MNTFGALPRFVAAIIALGVAACSGADQGGSTGDSTGPVAAPSDPAAANDGAGTPPPKSPSSPPASQPPPSTGSSGNTKPPPVSIPKSVKLTGTATVTCSFQTLLQPFGSTCRLATTAVALEPPMPAGAKLSDYLVFQSSSLPNAPADRTKGLTIVAPAATASCGADLFGPGLFELVVSTQTPTGQLCGMPAGGLTAASFGGSFKATLDHAIYYPTGGSVSSSHWGFGYDVSLSIDLTVK